MSAVRQFIDEEHDLAWTPTMPRLSRSREPAGVPRTGLVRSTQYRNVVNEAVIAGAESHGLRRVADFNRAGGGSIAPLIREREVPTTRQPSQLTYPAAPRDRPWRCRGGRPNVSERPGARTRGARPDTGEIGERSVTSPAPAEPQPSIVMWMADRTVHRRSSDGRRADPIV